MTRIRQDINYLVEIYSHAKTEKDLGIPSKPRIDQFLSTKSPERQEAIRTSLLEAIQNPPTRIAGESDTEYITRYTQWNNQSTIYEELLVYNP